MDYLFLLSNPIANGYEKIFRTNFSNVEIILYFVYFGDRYSITSRQLFKICNSEIEKSRLDISSISI